MNRDEVRCWSILLITALFGVIGFWGWHATNSYSILGDAAHVVGDGLPFVGTLIIARGLPAEEQGPILEAAIRKVNLWFLLLSGLYLIVSGTINSTHPHVVSKWVVVFAVAELLGNAAQAYLAHSVKHVYHDHSTHQSQMFHLYGDIGASGGVLVSAVFIWFTGKGGIDIFVSILLGGYMIYLAAKIKLGHAHHHHAH